MTDATKPTAGSAAGRLGTDPIKAVSVISTGTTQIHPQHAFDSRVPMYAWILGTRRWTASAGCVERQRGSYDSAWHDPAAQAFSAPWVGVFPGSPRTISDVSRAVMRSVSPVLTISPAQ